MVAKPEPWQEGRRAWERLRVWFGGDNPGHGEIDALNTLSDVGRLRGLLDQAELAAVRTARRRGSSWAEIAARLGVTRQSAWERWRDLDEAVPGAAATAEPAAIAANQNRRRSNVSVPNVVGYTFAQARAVLLDKGLLAVGSTPGGGALDADEWSDAAVTDQSPESGARVPAGTPVTLWLGRGGSAGVREPRRPSPGPRSLRAMRDEPTQETRG